MTAHDRARVHTARVRSALGAFATRVRTVGGSGRVWILPICLAVGYVTGRAAHLRVNVSPSLPIGIYQVASGPPDREALVLLCLPVPLAQFGLSRGYLLRGGCPGGAAPIGKRILAVEGDTVRVTQEGLAVRGMLAARSRALITDARGRPLSAVPVGSYVVPPGFLWVAAPQSARSWDSRYYAGVPVAGVRGVLRPVWIAE